MAKEVIQQQSIPEDKDERQELLNQLKEELSLLEQGKKDSKKKIAEAIKDLKTRNQYNSRYLPPFVKSKRHKTIHKTCSTLVFAPSTLWKTICGWRYYNSSYEFADDENTMATCGKCLSLRGARRW